MVSCMSSMSAWSSGVSNSRTGCATRSRRGSPIFRISRTVMRGAYRATSSRRSVARHQRTEALLVQDGHAQLARLLQLAARFCAGDHVVRLLAHGAGDLGGHHAHAKSSPRMGPLI